MTFFTQRTYIPYLLMGLMLLLTAFHPIKAQVSLTGTAYNETFDNLSAGLPTGWTVRTGATATSLGTSVSLVTNQTSWATTSGNFRNVASADGLTSTASVADQNASTDRALAVRQTGGFGDPGAAFVLQLDNTANYQNFVLAFKLQSLDASSTRTVTWRVDYSVGVTPTTFTDAGASGTLTTGGSTFANQAITVNFGSALNNHGVPVWIRIVTTTSSTGSGNRPTTGIDDVSLSYAPAGATTPTLAATPTTLTNFTTTQGTPSAAQSFTLTGQNLSPSSFTATAPQGFEISLDPPASYTNQFTFANLPDPFNVRINVRVASTAPVGSVSGTVLLTGSNGTSASVAVSGQVFPPPGQFLPIAQARGLADNTSTVIAGRVTVSNQFGGRLFYIQDGTGGIAVYSGAAPAPSYGSQVQLGDSVQVSGPISTFQGKKEINGVTSFTLVSGVANRVPTPVVITPGQMAAYEGQLVKINQATIGDPGPNFAGSTNYPITASGQSAELRIDPNTALVGRGKPTMPVDITGISDRFTSGSTSLLQLLPRTLDDLPTTDPVAIADQYCGGTGGSELTRDQTFDIAAWNLEFFGADGGSFTCPTGPVRIYEDFGPANEDLQAQNVKTVLDKLNADVIVTEEVSDEARLRQTISGSGYSLVCSDKFSYYFQDQCDQTYDANGNVFGPTSLAQKVCVLYKISTVMPLLAESRPLLDSKYAYPNANNWSSGRLPYLFVANVTVNGVTKKMHIVGIHAKSGSATADYARRKQDILDLKAELDQTYPNANVIVLGDYNDQILTSIASSQASTYKPFDDDAANYTILTKPLEAQGCRTFQSGSFLDHITISNDLQPAYVANTTTVLTPGIDDYNNTTSDHSPVFARFDLSKLNPPVSTSALVLTTPTYNCQTGAFTFNTTGGDGTTITYSAIGITGPTTDPNQFVDMGLRTATDIQPLTLYATQSGATVQYTWDIRAVCPVGPTPPVSTSALQLTAPTYNCQTGAFTFNTTGGDGTTITYQAIGITGPTTDPNQFVDVGLRTATDIQPLTLYATQSGMTVQYTWNIRTVCPVGARLGAEPTAESALQLRVLGNPVQNGRVTVEVTGAADQPLTLSLIDSRGQILSSHPIERAGSQERHTFELSRRSAGLLLLRAITPTQTRTVKILTVE